MSALANYLRGSGRLLAADPVPRDKLADALKKADDQALRAGDIIRRLREFVARGKTDRRADEANVSDLKAAFLQSAEVIERGNRYHKERLALIRKRDIVDIIARDPFRIFLHIVPSDAFAVTTAVSPRDALAIEAEFRPLAQTDRTPQISFDGFLSYRGGPARHGYTLDELAEQHLQRSRSSSR